MKLRTRPRARDLVPEPHVEGGRSKTPDGLLDAFARAYGPGYGFCIPHGIDVGQGVAAVGERDGVGLCSDCLRAHDRRAADRAIDRVFDSGRA